MDSPDSLVELYRRHVKHTPEKAVVVDVTILLAYLPKALVRTGVFSSQKVYISTRVLKHMYDKKPAEELDAIISNLSRMINLVEEVYEDLEAKRGDYCLVSQVKGQRYMCSIELGEENCVVTAFRVRDEKYLAKYKVLWSRKGGIPSS